ncbi:nucleotide-diphospho-sugar transferase-domain-containing protein [Haematococcus lacustris]
MDRRPRTPRSQAQLAIAVTAALGFVAGLLTVHYSKQRVSDPLATQARLLSERDALLDKVKAWNKRATELDASLPSLPALQLESSPVSTSSASSCAVCDPEDSEAKFRMRPKAEVARENPELVSLLAKHAINNEIMLTLANGIMICKNTTICWWNGGNILESFLTILSRAKITNYLIGVMDDETEQYLKGRDVNYFRVNIPVPKVQAKSHPANQVSTIKYTLLKTLLQLGVNTLITDMDLVYISNPFDHLHRDADIEVQTDGFDDMAYGQLESVHDPSMGWGGGGLYFHTFTTNVGCMWVKANARSFKLMAQVSDHLSQQQGWDQQIFNEYLMRPSHGDFQNAYAHLRVMDYTLFMNSKIFFRSRRTEYIPGATSKAPTPVMVHFNYHPDKHKRMLCIMDRYLFNNVSACDHMPGGSEPNT